MLDEMTAPRVLARARQIVDPALRAAVADLPDTVRRIVEYHLGWTDADGTPVPGEGGKRVRAALAVLGAEIVGADDATAAAGAAAVELMHNFTLLHDDIMDGDGTRRHRPTAWRAFGVGPAMLAGDALLVRAVELVQDTATRGAPDAARLLTRTAMALVAGQSADLDGPRDLAGYRVMAAGKTGSLLACALSIGPVLAGAPASRTAALSRAGTQLGCAFQAVDDLLGCGAARRTPASPPAPTCARASGPCRCCSRSTRARRRQRRCARCSPAPPGARTTARGRRPGRGRRRP
ncbi:polyprenyl synthetase family protein [Luedemannella flava]